MSFNVSGILVSDEGAAKAAQALSFAYIKEAPAKLINALLLDILGETKISTMDPHNFDEMTRDTIEKVQSKCNYLSLLIHLL